MPQTAAKQRKAEEAVKKIRLPSCPMILTRLLREMRADEPDFVQVAKLISSDVSLAGSMLQTVNSPFYGLRVKIGSVQHALNVIGLRNVRSSPACSCGTRSRAGPPRRCRRTGSRHSASRS
jgi:HD-like signal output (HDOD) protein